MNSGYSASATGGWKSAGNEPRSDDISFEEEGRPSSRGTRQPSALNTSAPSPSFIPPSTTSSSPSTYRRASIYPSSPSYGDLNNPTAPPMFDPRETNSIRDNITQLVNKNHSTSSGQSGENQPRGLAGLMGGASKAPRLHRAGTGPTADEREITERLEREMEISKAKWSGKLEGNREGVVGLSMASVMQGRANSAGGMVGAQEKQRWAVRGTPAKVHAKESAPRPVQPVVPVGVSPAAIPAPPSIAITTKTATVFTRAPPASTSTPSIPFPSTRSISPAPTTSLTAPTTTTSLTTKTATSPSSLAFPSTPLSLATALGSTSTGPRLNRPTPSPSFASPSPSFPFPSPSPIASQSPPVALPGLVRTPSSVRERARSLATLGGQEWVPKELIEVRSYTRSTEGIVADRLKLAESPRGSPRLSGASAGGDSGATGGVGVGVGESPSKKRSVLERWNRDEADQKGLASPSPTKKIEGRWSGRSQSVDIRDNSTLRTFERPSTTTTTLPLPPLSSPAPSPSLSPSASKPLLPPPRSASAQGSPQLAPSAPSPPRGVRGDPSPRFDSPPMDDSMWGELGSTSASSATTSPTLLKSAVGHTSGGGRVVPSRGWTAPVIGVKEYKKPEIFSSSREKEGEKDGLGLGIGREKVALPGMIVPSKRPLAVGASSEKVIPMDEDTPRPWSPSKRPTTTHTASYTVSSSTAIPPSTSTRSKREGEIERPISAAKLDELLASTGSPPRSSVKNAAATWGTPSRSTSSGSLNETGGGIGGGSGSGVVLGVTYPTPQRARMIWQGPPFAGSSVDSARQSRQREGTIQMFSFTPHGVTHPPPETDISLLYETESILLISPKTNRAFLWTGRENFLEAKGVEKRIREVAHGVEEVVRCAQGAESREFVELVGGRLVVRQGTRDAYDVNDSRLYRVSYEGDGLLFIDEDNLSIDSLCSKNCAVITLLGQVNIWIGRGSTALEQRSTLDFAKQIAGDRRITSYEESHETPDFWSILDGDPEDYAHAHHWLYRPTSSNPYPSPTLYTLDSLGRPIVNSTSSPLKNGELHVLRTELEYFLLVPSSLRNDAEKIEQGINAMQSLSAHSATGRKVQGILLFPSTLPRDVRLAYRGLEGRMRELNEGEEVRRMNFWEVEEYRLEFLSRE